MIYNYEQTLQILYRHLHSSLCRTHIKQFTGKKIAINANSLLRQFLLKPSVDPSVPKNGFLPNRHVQGFHEVASYLKEKKITPLFVFEDTSAFKGYGSEQLRRHFQKDQGIIGLKFEQDKILKLQKAKEVFHAFHSYLVDRRNLTQEIYNRARVEFLDAEELLREEDENPTVLVHHFDKLTSTPNIYFQRAITSLLSIHETANDFARSHLQIAGVQYERKVLELFEKLNVHPMNGNINLEEEALLYIEHFLDCAITCAKASMPSLQCQTENWEDKEQQVVELLKLMKLPYAFTSSNSADAVCSQLLKENCALAVTDNPFILGYQIHSSGAFMFNFSQPLSHHLVIKPKTFLFDLSLSLKEIRDFLILCDGDINQGYRGLEPDFLIQMIKKHNCIENTRTFLPNQTSANFNPDRSREFFSQKVTIPKNLLNPPKLSKNDGSIKDFLTALDVPVEPRYTFFQAPHTLPDDINSTAMNINPKILEKIIGDGSKTARMPKTFIRRR